MSSCERTFRAGEHRSATEICVRTGDGKDLHWAIQAYMSLGDLEGVERLAYKLLARPHQGDGWWYLGNVLREREDLQGARTYTHLALATHRLVGDEEGLVSDAVQLANITWQAGDFAASLAAADDALKRAQHLNDHRSVARAYRARADALRRMGDTAAATTALETMSDRATSFCDRAWAHLKLAMLRMERRQDGFATSELAQAEQLNGGCRADRDSISWSIAINRAWLMRRQDPAQALRLAGELARPGEETLEIHLLRGLITAERGALDEADEHLARADASPPPDADWPWVVAGVRAQLLEHRGALFDEVAAEYQYRRSIAMVAALRARSQAHSAHLLSSHRAPYEGLVALLARTGRWREALEVILELDASDMLRATSDPAAPPASRAVRSPPTVAATLSAWRGRELVIVIAPAPRELGPGGERVYRLRVVGGEVTGEDMGDAGAARRAAEALFVDPTDRAVARELGRIVVPAERATDTLHVLAIGPLGKLPLAALRDERGTLVIAARPLARVLGLRAVGPASRGAGPPVVIADPLGKLPAAVLEGALAAAALGPATRRWGSGLAMSATQLRLWEARDAEVLHIAAHVVVRGPGRALELADAEVPPDAIVKARLAPRLAVLASCTSAAATDEEGWGSIAAALIESGTSAVIATHRTIEDAATLALMRELYAQPDWRTDPARALANAQRTLEARSGAESNWAMFFVLHRPPAIP